MNYLIIATHFDDETLGCGGTIKKLKDDGHNVTILVITSVEEDPSKNPRYAEFIGVAEILSCSYTFSFNKFKDQKMSYENVANIADLISNTIKNIPNIDIVIAPFYGDLNSDHKLVSEAALIATRPHQTNIKEIWMYEVQETTRLGTIPFVPNLYVDIDWDFKEKLLKKYKSILKTNNHFRSLKSLKTQAQYRGQAINSNYAEAFFIYRKIL